jgi:hypothetical protein
MRFLLAILAVAFSTTACNPSGTGEAQTSARQRTLQEIQSKQRAAEEQAEIERAAALATCRSKQADLLALHKKLLAEQNPNEAANTVRRCALLTKDSALEAALSQAETFQDRLTVSNAKATPSDRLRAYSALKSIDPKSVKKLEGEMNRLSLKEAERERLENHAKRWKNSVRLGQTSAEVVAAGWGRPDEINRTTTAAGVREQWVYGLRQYLYFENGVLTGIQD